MILELNRYIEHTCLKQDATRRDIDRLIEEAREYNFLGICVNPSAVAYARERLGKDSIKLISVIGFPLGATLRSVKRFEAENVLKSGLVDEIDMVMNLYEFKSGNYREVIEEIKEIKEVIECKSNRRKLLKVIIETDMLSKEEIEIACNCCIEGTADFVKTSSGFCKDSIGATVTNVELIRDIVEDYGIKVKASGSIRDKVKAIELVRAGACRLGTSSSVGIMKEIVDKK